MSATFSVTPTDLSPSEIMNFLELNAINLSAAGRYALTMSTGSPLKDYAVWHVAGTQGNVVADLGYTGNTLIAVALYAGEYAATLTLYETDKVAMNVGPCTIVDTAGRSHTRCRLKDSREQGPPKGFSVNANTYVFFTVTYVFDQHGYVSES